MSKLPSTTSTAASAACTTIASTGVPVRAWMRPAKRGRRAVPGHRVVEPGREGHEREQRRGHEHDHERRQRAAAARAEEGDARLGGEGLVGSDRLDRHQVEEHGAHRDVEQRHGAHAERERPRQHAARVAHLARELRRLPPAAEREEREHEGARQRRHEGRGSGTPGEERLEASRARPRPRRSPTPRGPPAGRSWRAPGRGRWRPRSARPGRWPRRSRGSRRAPPLSGTGRGRWPARRRRGPSRAPR